MLKWESHCPQSNEGLDEFFVNDDDEGDVEYPKHTLQAIALALIRLCSSNEMLLEENRR